MKWIALAAALLPHTLDAQVAQGPANADFAPAFAQQTRAPALGETDVTVELVARGLEHPWGIAPLGEGQWLVTERPGRMRILSADGSLSDPVTGLPQVAVSRQGGLLDVAVGADGTVFWTYAKQVPGGYVTAAAQGRLQRTANGGAMTQVRDIFVQTPPSPNQTHYGARIVPDGRHVFITTGEHFSASERVLAQDVTTTYGKVIRLGADGSVPRGNPFVGREGDDSIWSFGHRNVQGATIGPDGQLWTIEHGPRGGDELNRPIAGGNFGWPIISYGINYNGSDVADGRAVQGGMEQPVYYWDPVIAPGGMTFYDGRLFDWRGDLLIGSLNPGGLVRLRVRDGLVVGEERLFVGEGRIRDVEVAPDGSVLMLLDQQNGAVLRVRPAP